MDTVLSRQYPGGQDLSGGQWQRVALARAFFAVECGAQVLVLDEPTAQLDIRAEVEFFDRFLAMIQGYGAVGGVRILSEAAVHAMETVQTDGLSVTYSPSGATLDGYGIGNWVNRTSSGLVLASPGALGAFPMIDRGHCYRLVMLPTSSSGPKSRDEMAVVKPELDRQLHC